ncbi:HEAT repeat domain-containing protein [Geomesophilobacter sediminis]|uniref:HEAT repeat domain-containing protein n=1 Tax=Geomesophilobacter sediminis TaxID=2798584 RepID=A0A8J7JGU9_9BACT|nr:HEAT repeat domain-containing protein [Geomesophilobacter sediminis]MBJ6726189.1 HEAT repeat domain-containing protein [Geomesophilobacter sediminis]
MRTSTNVDTSFKERRGVLELLEKIRNDQVSLAELEEIGIRLKQAGNRALRPLLRELSRECRGELISKYAYILDFFEEDAWLDQLIAISLKRRDLGEDGKAALQVALRGYGVDIASPQFRAVFGSSTTFERTLKGEPGMEGLVRFLDDFLSYPAEFQQLILRGIERSGHRDVTRVLEAMLWHEEPSIVSGALQALGRVREPRAASVLRRYLEEGALEHRAACRLSLRRLAFLGVEPEDEPPPLPFHAGYASVPDGDGYRSLMISRWISPGRVSALYLQVHERRGLLAAWGGDSLTGDEFRAELEAFSADEELHQVEPSHVVELLADALYFSRDLAYLPADFYLQRGMFRGEDLTPRRYRPQFGEQRPRRAMSYAEGEEASAQLFSDPFFAACFMADERVYDFAAEHGPSSSEALLKRFCSELLSPKLDRIRERLLLSADLMRRCGRDRRAVARVVGLAESLEGYRLPHHLHPFLRRFALESLQAAHGALSSDCAASAEAGQNAD